MSTDFPTAIQTRDDVLAGRTSAEDVCEKALQRAHAAQRRLNAFIDILDDDAMRMARAVDAQLAAPALGSESRATPAVDLPLAGVPIVLKDNICLSAGRTTCGSRLLEDYHSPFTATAAQRLIDAGAVVIAKANLDEFGMGSTGEQSAFGCVRNPFDETRVTGGSSAGSAAAVAAGVVPVALGSDTGGSIRQPAGWCGLVGLKPTYGRVSRSGLVAYASSLDQLGPLTRTVDDAALVAQIIMGLDPLDSTSADEPVPDLLPEISRQPKGLTVGVPGFARNEANHPDVAAALERTITALREMGVKVIDIDLPHAPHGIAAYYLVATAEASSNLARFDGVRYGQIPDAAASASSLEEFYSRVRGEMLGKEVQRRIMLGTYVLSAGYYDAYYTTALKVRRLIRRDYDRAFAERGCDAVLMPTSPGPAIRLEEKTGDPLAMYLEDIYTVGVNLAGLPSVAFPAGTAALTEGNTTTRLPIGMQLVGNVMDELAILRLARGLEVAE